MKKAFTNLFIVGLMLLAFAGCNSSAPPENLPSSQEAAGPSQSVSEPQSSEPAIDSEPEAEPEPDYGFEKKTVTLNSGYEMPILGLGTFTLDNQTTENSVYHALKSGYRLIDTAKYYQNEAAVGKGVRRAMEEGIVTREEIFITTKILPYGFADYDAAIAASNQQLGLDYIDLMLIHVQGSDQKKLYGAIERAIEAGTVHSLGISNVYTQADFERMTQDAQILPAVVQNENHPFYQNTELKEYLSQYGIYVESYYPLGGRGHTKDLFDNQVIRGLVEKHGKSPAQILLRWHIQAGYITIPGSSNPEHIAENYDIFGFALSEEDMQKIANLNAGKRYESW